MGVKAYILINTEVGRSADIINSLKELKGVKLISVTAGEFDIIVRAEVEDLEALYKLVEDLQDIKGIVRTLTHVVLKEASRE